MNIAHRPNFEKERSSLLIISTISDHTIIEGFIALYLLIRILVFLKRRFSKFFG